MKTLDSVACEIIKQREEAIEGLMIETLERHLGRVPTDMEVAKNGKRIYLTAHNEEHFMWGGFRLFSIYNHKTGYGFDVERCV